MPIGVQTLGCFWSWWGNDIITTHKRCKDQRLTQAHRALVVSPSGLDTPQGTYESIQECGQSLALVASWQSWGHIILPGWSWADDLSLCFFISKMGDTLWLAGWWVTDLYPELVLGWRGSIGGNCPSVFAQNKMSICRARISPNSHIECAV